MDKTFGWAEDTSASGWAEEGQSNSGGLFVENKTVVMVGTYFGWDEDNKSLGWSEEGNLNSGGVFAESLI